MQEAQLLFKGQRPDLKPVQRAPQGVAPQETKQKNVLVNIRQEQLSLSPSLVVKIA